MTSLLPLLHLHDLVPVEAAHLQLPVEVPHRERHEVLVRNAALQGDTFIMKVKIIPCEGSSCSQYLDLGQLLRASRPSPSKKLLLVQGTRQMQIYDECSRNSYDYEIRDYDTIQDPCMAKQPWPAPTLPGWRSVEVIQNYNVVNVT